MFSSGRTTTQRIQSLSVQRWIHEDAWKVPSLDERRQSLFPERFLPTDRDHVSINTDKYEHFDQFSQTVLFQAVEFDTNVFLFLFAPRMKIKNQTYCVDPASKVGKIFLQKKLQ